MQILIPPECLVGRRAPFLLVRTQEAKKLARRAFSSLLFDQYTIEEADHEHYRCGSDPGQGKLRRRLTFLSKSINYIYTIWYMKSLT
ncbi:hypothetical protein R3W88_007290 [Solanum pinnatisectum]|uniref:Uncharacterized protein n=1 Tax=Solanum pinnatisectum TaxID=50273 RepID=A0AAV9M597_9SOLN|nr:hypothetical protein R3W88_007290 [Solanum pinnatisectum]